MSYNMSICNVHEFLNCIRFDVIYLATFDLGAITHMIADSFRLNYPIEALRTDSFCIMVL